MMTGRRWLLLGLAAAVIVAVSGLAPGAAAEAQEVTPYYRLGWSPSPVHYHRVYQGTYWHWSPWLGWHLHDHYVDVPHRAPAYYVYDPYRRAGVSRYYYYP
jgi:hypothetical protein